MTITQIEDALYEWLTNESGWTVIFANQAGARPQLPYCTIRIYATISKGLSDEQRQTDASGVMTLRKIRLISASIQFYGDNAREQGESIRTALSKPSALEFLRNKGLVVQDVGDLQDLTAMQETEWEERSQFDLTLGTGDDYTDEVGLIEHVELEEQFRQPDKQVNIVIE